MDEAPLSQAWSDWFKATAAVSGSCMGLGTVIALLSDGPTDVREIVTIGLWGALPTTVLFLGAWLVTAALGVWHRIVEWDRRERESLPARLIEWEREFQEKRARR